MMDIYEQTNEFMDKVKATRVYTRYLEAKAVIEADKNLKFQLDEFRRRSFEIQAGHNYGYYNSYEQLLNLNTQYEDLLSKLEVEEFLNAELELSKSVSKIIEIITQEIDVNLDFLNH